MKTLGEEKSNSPKMPNKSYKDSLLFSPGPMMEENIILEETINADEPNFEDRWYKENVELSKSDESFDPCQIIPVWKDEFDEWCKSWHAMLIFKVLEKRVNLGFMEQRLNCDWVKKNCDYFLVIFSTIELERKEANHTRVTDDDDSTNQGDSNLIMLQVDNQDHPNFGLWMMVKQLIKKKSKKYISGNKDKNSVREIRLNKEGSNKERDLSIDEGSRFNVLEDETNEEPCGMEVHENFTHEETIQVG
ncbi:uncharacterized protein DS421_16g550260 [Arachis hypogaea]|nr:uncharacterized protein DS421_16g550260 [Arachis hypogaea]